MRITRDQLLKIAEDTVAERARADKSILAAYLHGSLLEGNEPLLGGAADIDLTFIHIGVDEPREILRMSDDISLDILHHAREDYEPARTLRQKPMLGPAVFYAKPLYDPQHFLDFTQASARGMYGEPENVLARSEPGLTTARRYWFSAQGSPTDGGTRGTLDYLTALGQTANAVAGLSGPALTVRRLLLDFPARAAAVGHEGLAAGLLGLMGGMGVDAAQITGWLPDSTAAYTALGRAGLAPAELAPARQAYYEKAIRALAEGGQPAAALWPLLTTWTAAVAELGEGTEAALRWEDALAPLGLVGDGLKEKLAGLDAYLDRVEELFDRWKRERGLL
ncbi:MAG: hypothetical protein EPO32_07995 [Anaerolineae bacterium]|nr:MAG: hypothetical protein EPO32_07995 [Anaerolineae bacterium]